MTAPDDATAGRWAPESSPAAAGVGCRWRDSKSRDGKLGRAGGTARITVSSDSAGQFLLADDRPLLDVPSPEDRDDRAGGSGSS